MYEFGKGGESIWCNASPQAKSWDRRCEEIEEVLVCIPNSCYPIFTSFRSPILILCGSVWLPEQIFFWTFAKVKCTSSPGLITRWTLSTPNFCPSGFARSHRKLFLFLKFPFFCSLISTLGHTHDRFWLCEVMKLDVHDISQSKDRLQIWWHTFQREKTMKIWALKKLQDLSNQVLYAKMFLILGILWMFSMTHYILHRW